MTKWIVETKATVRRIYYVEGSNEKDAIERTNIVHPDLSEDTNEETVSVTLDVNG